MMPAPLAFEAMCDLDLVLCTHRHGDHMDPLALPVIARNNPRCRFVVPRAELESARAIGLAAEKLVPINAGETVAVAPALSVEAVASAHEQLKLNERGEHHFLGYILRLGGRTLYHSGDCVVYDGLAAKLANGAIDLALLPINGRREELTRHGVIGNMSFSEAVELCAAAGIGAMLGHHIGMFDFNTVDPLELQKQIAGVDQARLQCTLPRIESFYTLQ
jgi:L-ascorbate metabolism protein UlaG (beta-lactamase superfamily)